MDVKQVLLLLEELEQKLLDLEVTAFPPSIPIFTQQFLLCEEEIVKKLVVFTTPQVTKIHADLMIGECGGGPCVEGSSPKIYEFGGFTGSKCELQVKLKPQLQKIWGPDSEFVKQMKERVKKMIQEFVKALKGLFKDVKNLITALIEAFILIGSSIVAITMIIIAPPWNIAEAIVHVIQIIRALKTIIVAFVALLVYLQPLSILFLLFPKDKLKQVLAAIAGVIQIILKLLSPIDKLVKFISKILEFLKKRKPSCERQRKRLEKKIRKATRKKNRFERRASRRGRRAGHPRWKDDFFDPDSDHISYGGDLEYRTAERISRNDVELEEDDDIEKFADAMEGFDDTNEEIKGLEEQLDNVCKGSGEELDTDGEGQGVVDEASDDGSTGEDESLDQQSDFDDLEVIRIVIANKGVGYASGGNGDFDVVFTNPPGFEGTQARAKYFVRNGQIVSTLITEFGSGYYPPTKAQTQLDPTGIGAVLIPQLGRRPRSTNQNNAGGQNQNNDGFGTSTSQGQGTNFTSTGGSTSGGTGSGGATQGSPFGGGQIPREGEFIAESSGNLSYKLFRIRVFDSGSGYSSSPELSGASNPIKLLDRPGNVISLCGSNSSLRNKPSASNRTSINGDGYVSGLKGSIVPTPSSFTFSVKYDISGESFAIFGDKKTNIPSSHTYNLSSGGLSDGTYSQVFFLTTSGEFKTLRDTSPPFINPSDIALSWVRYRIENGIFSEPPILEPVTIDENGYIELIHGVNDDYYVSKLPPDNKVINVLFNGTSGTIGTNQYRKYRRIKAFNSLVSFLESSSKNNGSMLSDFNGKIPLRNVSLKNVVRSINSDKSLQLQLPNSSSTFLDDGVIVIYKVDDENLNTTLPNQNNNTLPIEFTNPVGFDGVSGKGYVTLKEGKVDKAFLTEQGSGYTIPPILRVTTGGGQGAKLMAELFPNPEKKNDDTPPVSPTPGSPSENSSDGTDLISDIEKLADGFDENLIDQLLDRLITSDLGAIDQDIQNITVEFQTYAVKYPDGTIQRGVTEEELEELKERFTVEMRSTIESIS